MIILGKTPDKMKGSEGTTDEDILRQFFLGKTSGQSNVELDVDNGKFVFDTNNINKAVPSGVTKHNVQEVATPSFINNAKFYTCSKNGQDKVGLCFRCVDTCVACALCHSACNGCQTCTGCRDCNTYVTGVGIQ